MAQQTMDRPDVTPGGGHPVEDHPTPKLYVQVAGALFILTMMEFSTYFIDFGGAHTPLLIALMSIKFVMVAGFFMHLKYDTRLFTRLMGTGLVGAVVLYLVAFLALSEITRNVGL